MIDRLKTQQAQYADLSLQLATGKKTQKFTGLKSDVLTDQRARADFKSLEKYSENITNADRRLSLISSSIAQFKSQARVFSGALLNLSQESVHQEGEVVYFDDPTTPDVVEAIPVGQSSAESDIDFKALQDLADSILDFAKEILNAQDGERFLFGGAESSVKPLNDTGTLDAAIESMLGEWRNGTITNEELVANLTDRTTENGNSDALTDSVIGYNSTLSSGNAKGVFVRVSDTAEISYTTLANDQAFRDIIVAASYIKSAALGPIADQVEIDDATGLPVVLTQGAPGETTDEMKGNFFSVINSLVGVVSRGIDNIDRSSFNIENTRARLQTIDINYKEQRNVLLNTVGSIEDVDLNEVALQINTLGIQLDASYRVTATLRDLSLVNFI